MHLKNLNVNCKGFSALMIIFLLFAHRNAQRFGPEEKGKSDTQIDSEEADRLGSCRISSDDTKTFPWLGYLRISTNHTHETEKDAYWPVVIIGNTTLLTGARAFRSPYSDGKFNLTDLNRLHVRLKDETNITYHVSSVQLNPGVTGRPEHWMSVDNDFALIHLKQSIEFSDRVRPLCLPTWRSMVEANAVLKPKEVTVISGWKCSYLYALQRMDVNLHLEMNSTEQCQDVWSRQADYVDDETMGYNNRICGTPIRNTSEGQTPDPTEHGLCAEKFYLHIHTRQNDERVVSGLFNGIAHEVYQGPTAYVLLLKPSTIDWIKASIACGADKFTCHDQSHETKCIDLDSECDRTPHCKDGSDENPIYCRAKKYCSANEYECGVHGECRDLDKVTECNILSDCRGGEDEEKCPSLLWLYLTFGFVGFVAFVASVFNGYRIVAKRRTSSKSYLTEDEIFEFRQGITTNGAWADDNSQSEFIGVGEGTGMEAGGSDCDVQCNSMQMPYIYDLQRHQIKLKEIIGGGAFGIVYKGIVNGKAVAIKVLKRDIVNKEMFKTFLVELKIMSFVNFIKGGHENVIRLVGAHTEEIRNLQLFIVVEYCQNGSIADYLRENRSQFEATEDQMAENRPRNLPYSYVAASSLQQQSGINYLHTWALQIVDGMNFLATHKVIHGDLAARNVLLVDSNLNAKISDFGLSRQIYYYNISSAKIGKNTMLPWRWMAPEVITTMKISSKSDVWSFGITLWELFTLGSVPYGGLEWNPCFVEQLKCGVRLIKPEYANDRLFTIMQDCWRYNADDRPDFEFLRNILSSFSWTDLDLNMFAY